MAGEITAAGGKAIAVPTDVTDDAALRRAAEAARSEFGRLDIWVNNAGGSPLQVPLTQLPREEMLSTLPPSSMSSAAMQVEAQMAVRAEFSLGLG